MPAIRMQSGMGQAFLLMIDAEIHEAVFLALSPDERRDRARVNAVVTQLGTRGRSRMAAP
jgi:hypothetical protein